MILIKRRYVISVAAMALCTFVSLNEPVLACRGWPFETHTLLDSVPPAAAGSPIIAKVEILRLEVKEEPGLRPLTVAYARVVEPIKGVEKRQVIAIFADHSSCGGGINPSDIGRQAFIAGQNTDHGYFVGRWNNEQILGTQ